MTIDLPPNRSGPVVPPAGCLTYGLWIAAMIWICSIGIGMQVLAWGFDQYQIGRDLSLPWWAWPLIAIIQGGALALPVVLLAVLTQAARFRAIYRTWLLAIAIST